MSQSEVHKVSVIARVRITLAMICTTGLGYWPLYVMPFVVGALVENLHLSGAQAGFVATTELAAAALTAFFGAGLAARAKRPGRLALLSALFIALANLASAGVSGYFPLIILRALTGLGEGVALALGAAALGRVDGPDRYYALVMVGRGLTGTAMIPIIAYAIRLFEHKGAFAFLAITPIILAPFVIGLPNGAEGSSREAPSATQEAGFSHSAASILLLSAVFFLSLGEATWYTFIERRGAEIGLSIEAIANVLAIATISGIAGAAIPALLGQRAGRAVPIFAGMLVVLASGAASLLTGGVMTYSIANAVFTIGFAIVIPFSFGVSTVLNRSGSLSAALGSMIVAGYVVGPSLAGVTLTRGGYESLAFLFACIVFIAIIAFVALFLSRTYREARL